MVGALSLRGFRNRARFLIATITAGSSKVFTPTVDRPLRRSDIKFLHRSLIRALQTVGVVMGIYDREYYRDGSRGPIWISSVAPVCKAIIAINVLLHVAVLVFSDLPIIDWLEADSHLIFEKLQVWRLATSAFVHDPNHLQHLLINMLMLWFVGREVEEIYGGREFLLMYLTAAVVSTLLWCLVDYFGSGADGRSSAIGALGAIYALAVVFVMYYPTRNLVSVRLADADVAVVGALHQLRFILFAVAVERRFAAADCFREPYWRGGVWVLLQAVRLALVSLDRPSLEEAQAEVSSAVAGRSGGATRASGRPCSLARRFGNGKGRRAWRCSASHASGRCRA